MFILGSELTDIRLKSSSIDNRATVFEFGLDGINSFRLVSPFDESLDFFCMSLIGLKVVVVFNSFRLSFDRSEIRTDSSRLISESIDREDICDCFCPAFVCLDVTDIFDCLGLSFGRADAIDSSRLLTVISDCSDTSQLLSVTSDCVEGGDFCTCFWISFLCAEVVDPSPVLSEFRDRVTVADCFDLSFFCVGVADSLRLNSAADVRISVVDCFCLSFICLENIHVFDCL